MRLARPHLTVLLNALYQTGTETVTVSHPSRTVGELFEFELGDPQASRVRVLQDERGYADARSIVDREHGAPAIDELPDPQSYVNAFLAGGLLDPPNRAAVDEFFHGNGGRDLSAGHPPAVAGFDTNLLAWRIADVLGLIPGQDGVVNGFAVATGVRDELDWDYKRTDTRGLEEAFGPEFEQLWNQPAGRNREGRLGENYYRRLRDHRYADEVESDPGDEAIVRAYDRYQRDARKDVLLLSNDRDFIERARSKRVLAHRVELPDTLPSRVTGSWSEIQDTLYVLTVLFGVLSLPKVTLYGVWRGKGGQAWHREDLDLDCRSPKIEPLIRRDLTIIDSYARE